MNHVPLYMLNLLFFLGSFGLVGGIFFVTNRMVKKKLAAQFERTNPSAEVRGYCVISDGLEQMGVVQILDGNLYIYPFLGEDICIPLNQIKVKKIRRNNYFGHYMWWNTTIFKLDTPYNYNMALGIKGNNTAPWENILKVTE